jgi:hypothetical protein
MPDRITGGCLCGKITYTYDGSVGPASYCHCQDCRRVTGSAFSIAIAVKRDNLHVAGDSLESYTKLGDSGSEITRHFCRSCGSQLYGSSPRDPDSVYLKAGTLDDPMVVKPDRQRWLSSAVSWSQIPQGIDSYDKGRNSSDA